jgi:hypothetical protein
MAPSPTSAPKRRRSPRRNREDGKTEHRSNGSPNKNHVILTRKERPVSKCLLSKRERSTFKGKGFPSSNFHPAWFGSAFQPIVDFRHLLSDDRPLEAPLH